MTIRPILLKGHSRPLTKVKFNREGDLLFTCGKDHKPQVFWSDNGERLGTYDGHNGSVWDCDVSFDSSRLLTGSSDNTAKLWDVQSGKELLSIKHESGVRSVGFAHGEKMILTVQDNTFGKQPTIFIYNLDDDFSEEMEPVREMVPIDSTDKMNVALWGPLNHNLLSAGEDGCIREWDVERGVEVRKICEHKKSIQSMQFSKDYTMFITASSDKTAKVFDTKTLQLLKTFQSDRPLNGAAISPIMNHVMVGGGQEAMSVTTTAASSGRFEVDFHHIVYGDFLGNVRGHFGPINTLAFAPTGKMFASGAEDGYVRLHHFDNEYLKLKGKDL